MILWYEAPLLYHYYIHPCARLLDVVEHSKIIPEVKIYIEQPSSSCYLHYRPAFSNGAEVGLSSLLIHRLLGNFISRPLWVLTLIRLNSMGGLPLLTAVEIDNWCEKQRVCPNWKLNPEPRIKDPMPQSCVKRITDEDNNGSSCHCYVLCDVATMSPCDENFGLPSRGTQFGIAVALIKSCLHAFGFTSF